MRRQAKRKLVGVRDLATSARDVSSMLRTTERDSPPGADAHPLALRDCAHNFFERLGAPSGNRVHRSRTQQPWKVQTSTKLPKTFGLQGHIKQGGRGASGRGSDGVGSIAQQTSFFDARGVPRARQWFNGTINIDLTPWKYEIVRPNYEVMAAWHPDHPTFEEKHFGSWIWRSSSVRRAIPHISITRLPSVVKACSRTVHLHGSLDSTDQGLELRRSAHRDHPGGQGSRRAMTCKMSTHRAPFGRADWGSGLALAHVVRTARGRYTSKSPS